MPCTCKRTMSTLNACVCWEPAVAFKSSTLQYKEVVVLAGNTLSNKQVVAQYNMINQSCDHECVLDAKL